MPKLNLKPLLLKSKEPVDKLIALLKPWFQKSVDYKLLGLSALWGAVGFLALFSVLSLILAEKPYKLFETTVLNMPKTADIADIRKANALMAVFVSDAGLNSKIIDALADNLTPAYTIAMSPYAFTPKETLSKLAHRGYEIWLSTAMYAGRSGIDSGPLALRPDITPEENWDLLNRQLSSMTLDVRGLLLPQDSALPFANEPWQDFAKRILGQNLLVVDATQAQIPSALFLARTQAGQSAYIKADMVLDASVGFNALKTNLKEAASLSLAKKQFTVVLTNLNPKTVRLASAELLAMEKQGIAVVPASVLLTRGVTGK